MQRALLRPGRPLAGLLAAAGAARRALLPPLRVLLARRKLRRGAAAALWERMNTDTNNRPELCRLCGGEGTRPCEPCGGRGSLPATGFSPKNSVQLDRVVGTQWTAVRPVQGRWRHFRCVGRRGARARDAVCELVGACGPKEERLRIQVPVAELRRRALWAGGWVTMRDLEVAEGNAGALGGRCRNCSGNRVVICPRCDGAGECGGGVG